VLEQIPSKCYTGFETGVQMESSTVLMPADLQIGVRVTGPPPAVALTIDTGHRLVVGMALAHIRTVTSLASSLAAAAAGALPPAADGNVSIGAPQVGVPPVADDLHCGLFSLAPVLAGRPGGFAWIGGFAAGPDWWPCVAPN
jgi:hypothetical protein